MMILQERSSMTNYQKSDTAKHLIYSKHFKITKKYQIMMNRNSNHGFDGNFWYICIEACKKAYQSLYQKPIF